MATALTVAMSAKTLPAKAAENDANNSLAGISLSFDSYYTVAVEDELDILAASLEEHLPETARAAVNTEDQAEAATEAAATEEAAPAEEQIQESEYANTGISIAANYVNVRAEANTESEVVGKLYKGSAATITETVGEWVKIKSGKVVGYINSEYLAIGFSAEELVDKYGSRMVTVKAKTLRVREEKSTESKTLTLIPEGETYHVVSYDDQWVEISIDDDITGFISAEFVDMKVEFEKAISIEEELAQIAEQEERERLAAEAEAKRLEEEKRKQEEANANKNNSTSSNSSSSNNSTSTSNKKPSSSSSNTSSSNTSSSNTSSSNTSSSNTSSSNTSSSNSSSSSTSSSKISGSDVANYALKFVGNPYKYGGTSLTGGTDCSGFTMQVYKHFGYSIPRTSGAQASGAGKQVSLSSLKAGDLIFYKKGGVVNHVALYIGGGKVVHASTPKSGIKISTYNYRTPYMARRVIN